MRYRIYNGNEEGTFGRDSTLISAENFAGVLPAMIERGWRIREGQLFLAIEKPLESRNYPPRAVVFRYHGPSCEIIV